MASVYGSRTSDGLPVEVTAASGVVVGGVVDVVIDEVGEAGGAAGAEDVDTEAGVAPRGAKGS